MASCLLLSSPNEIRFNIWRHLLHQPVIELAGGVFGGDAVYTPPRISFPVAITFVSKQIRRETLPLLENDLHLEVNSRMDIQDLCVLPPGWLRRVKQLKVHLVYKDDHQNHTQSDLLEVGLLDVLPSLRCIDLDGQSVSSLEINGAQTKKDLHAMADENITKEALAYLEWDFVNRTDLMRSRRGAGIDFNLSFLFRADDALNPLENLEYQEVMHGSQANDVLD